MKPGYAITSNAEISYGEILSFWGIKYTYCKIIAVVKSTMLKKKNSVVQYKIMFISYHSNMSEIYEFYLEFRYLNLIKFII